MYLCLIIGAFKIFVYDLSKLNKCGTNLFKIGRFSDKRHVKFTDISGIEAKSNGHCHIVLLTPEKLTLCSKLPYGILTLE
jgi:hypothetical protein